MGRPRTDGASSSADSFRSFWYAESTPRRRPAHDNAEGSPKGRRAGDDRFEARFRTLASLWDVRRALSRPYPYPEPPTPNHPCLPATPPLST
jgi:hypothetical protein